MLAFLPSVPAHLGYVGLAAFVLAESAGLPVPGETALVAAALLAAGGQLSLPVVIAVAAVAAILGDNIGFVIGRRGGRAVLARAGGPLAAHRRRALAASDRFFQRHGPKAVFLGRWVTGVRVVAAFTAGASDMRWRTFAVYNALGAITWSATIAALAALVGPVVVGLLFAIGLSVAALSAAAAAFGRWRRRRATAGSVVA